MKTKTYIGDSVYAEFDGYSIILTTENGFGPSNTIIFEPEVWRDLKLWVEAVTARLSHEPSDPELIDANNQTHKA